jgi:hypothetical protein
VTVGAPAGPPPGVIPRRTGRVAWQAQHQQQAAQPRQGRNTRSCLGGAGAHHGVLEFIFRHGPAAGNEQQADQRWPTPDFEGGDGQQGCVPIGQGNSARMQATQGSDLSRISAGCYAPTGARGTDGAVCEPASALCPSPDASAYLPTDSSPIHQRCALDERRSAQPPPEWRRPSAAGDRCSIKKEYMASTAGLRSGDSRHGRARRDGVG